MILSVILRVSIDTPRWIEELRENEADCIAVVDYGYTGEPEQREDILYLSPLDAENYMKNFDSVEFFTCFYGFTVIGGNMSSLFGQKKDDVKE